MRYLVWALRLLVFVAVLMFALKNTDPVAVKFYADYVVQDVPLIDQCLQGAVGIAARQPDPGGQRIDGAGRIIHVRDRLQHHQPLEQCLVHFFGFPNI